MTRKSTDLRACLSTVLCLLNAKLNLTSSCNHILVTNACTKAMHNLFSLATTVFSARSELMEDFVINESIPGQKGAGLLPYPKMNL